MTRERQAGSVRPRVSSPKGSSSSPTANAIEVSATGMPTVPNRATPAPTRNVIPAPAKRPTDVANANALPRQSVEYYSGSQMVYIAKFAPPTPSRKSTTKKGASASAR